jgi:hypothetical protein
MIKKTFIRAVAIVASAMLASSAVAQANPVTSMTVIDDSAAQLCTYINANPTENGVVHGLMSLRSRRLDEMDAQLVVVTALQPRVCPQHDDLVMNSMASIAAEELCTEPS